MKCRAQLKVIEDESNPMHHPSTDPKPLPWGRLLELTDLREETNIHPFIGDELLHVVFSARWLDRNEQHGIDLQKSLFMIVSGEIRSEKKTVLLQGIL